MDFAARAGQEHGLKLDLVRIDGREQGIAGLHYRPERTPRPVAVLYAHGFTAGKYSVDSLAGYLAARGYEGLSIDFVGHKLGATGGRLERMEQVVDNLSDALAWLRANTDAREIVIVGHSMGAAATLAAAARERRLPVVPAVSRLAGIVCLCIGLHPASHFDSAIGQAMLAQRGDYVEGAPALHLLEQLEFIVDQAREVGNLPALFVAGRQDVLVTPGMVAEVADLVGPSSTLRELDTTHLDAPDRSRFLIGQWLGELK